MTERYGPSKPMMEILALWVVFNDITEPETLVSREMLALGMIDLGILRGTKRAVLRRIQKTNIPEQFRMDEISRISLCMVIVCPFNPNWVDRARRWVSENESALVQKGALKV